MALSQVGMITPLAPVIGNQLGTDSQCIVYTTLRGHNRAVGCGALHEALLKAKRGQCKNKASSPDPTTSFPRKGPNWFKLSLTGQPAPYRVQVRERRPHRKVSSFPKGLWSDLARASSHTATLGSQS